MTGGRVFFAAEDGVHGRRLSSPARGWSLTSPAAPARGTSSRSTACCFSRPRTASMASSPSGFLVSRVNVYVPAIDATHGFWAVPRGRSRSSGREGRGRARPAGASRVARYGGGPLQHWHCGVPSLQVVARASMHW